MKRLASGSAFLAIMLLVGFVAGVACDRAANMPATAVDNEPSEAKAGEQIQRVGMVIGLKKEKADRYRELHANPWPGVNAMIKKSNIRNYSIYECEIDGKLYLFSYFEYVGDDFEKDMAMMAADPTIKEWWAETDPCQNRMPGTPEGEQWLKIPERYHLD